MSDELLTKIESKIDQIDIKLEAKLEAKIDKIDLKLDKIHADVAESKIIQARHDENLKEHMKRTAILEDSSKFLYGQVVDIKLHTAKIDGIFKFIGVASTLVSCILGILKLFGRI